MLKLEKTEQHDSNKEDIKKKLNLFIKRTIIELACTESNNIKTIQKKKSELLRITKKNNYDIDLSIKQIVDELIKNKNNKLEKMIETFKSDNNNHKNMTKDKYYKKINDNGNQLLFYISDFIGINIFEQMNYNLNSNYENFIYEALIGIPYFNEKNNVNHEINNNTDDSDNYDDYNNHIN